MRTFSLFIHHQGSTTPTLHMEVADSLDLVCALAKKALAESPHRTAVDVREDDRLMFSLDRKGAIWSASDPRRRRQT